MRIGFDAKRAYRNTTGLGNYSRTLIGGLLRQFPEHEYLLASPRPSIFPNFSFPPIQDSATLPQEESAYTIFPPRTLPGSLWRTFGLGKTMRHYQADLFHGLSHELPIDIGHTPSVVTMHDVAFKTFPDMYQWADRKIYDAKWRFACRKATHVVAISESTKRDVQKYYQVGDDRISVIYQPVQELFYTPLSHDKAQEMLKRSIPSLPGEFLLSVGSVNSRKNLMNTLRAFADLPAENRPPLVVVGNGGHYLSECKAFADKHLSPNEVLWLHHVDSSLLLQALYTTALAMLYPSHYEGMGLPVIEALLQQCPVLTSNVSSLPEAAGPGALLVTPTDVGEISHALARLIEDSDLRQHLSTAGQAYARQKFTPALLTSQMMDLYKKITQ